MTLSINEFIKLIETEFGADSYRAVSPEGKVYARGNQFGLGRPAEDWVIPVLPTKPDSGTDVHVSTVNRSRTGRKK